MSARHKNGIKKYAAAVFFLVLMLGLNVNASAATWKLNANGTYSCYENGKLVRNKWITQGGNRYYVNSSGIRQTGWLFSGKRFTAPDQTEQCMLVECGGSTTNQEAIITRSVHVESG